MAARKQPEAGPPTPAQTGEKGRKPWKKKTPAEHMLGQINRLKDDLAKREEELKTLRRQLQKLEEVRKVLESN